MVMVPWWDRDSGCQCESGGECNIDSAPKNGGGGGGDIVGGTCGRRAWTAGAGQRVVAMSLYGNNSDYWIGLEENLSQVSSLQNCPPSVTSLPEVGLV